MCKKYEKQVESLKKESEKNLFEFDNIIVVFLLPIYIYFN